MSILLSPEPWKAPRHPWRSALWFLLYVLASIIAGGLLGAWLVRHGMREESGFWFMMVENHGGPRVMRRIQTLVAIVLAPWMLKQVGWRGGNDMGWSSAQTHSERRGDFIRGYLIGLLLCGLLLGTAMFTGVRVWKEFSLAGWGWMLVKDILITALGVGLIEETFTRGVLYRSMARSWSPWIGAVVSSLLFGYVHFLRVRPGRFEEGIWEAVHSALFESLQMDHAGLRLLNLTLFGLVLCRMVHYRGDIWMVAGFHASAVGILKLSFRQTLIADPSLHNTWIGGRSSFDDGWMMTVLLLVLLLLVEKTGVSRGASRRVRL